MHILATTFCLLVVGATVTAQQSGDTKPKPAAQRLVLRIEPAALGSPVPRVTDKEAAPALAKVKAWEGRKVTWSLDGTVLPNRKDAEAALDRAARDPKNLRDSKHQPGEREPVPVRLEPGDGARWCEVITAYDMLLTAGFREVQIEDVPTPWFVPRSVAEPILDDGVLVVPRMVFNEPDDRPEAGRPTFDVHQDGRIVLGDKVLFTWMPGKADDLTALRAHLLALRKDLVADGHLQVRAYDGEKRLDMPCLVRADLWTEWRDVRRLLMFVTLPEFGFWKLHPAVAEMEYEPKLRGGWRVPKAAK